MPLLSIVLKKVSGVKSNVELFGSIAKQPLILNSYFIDLEGEANTKLLVKLPFLNNYDANTNASIGGTIPLFLDVSYVYDGSDTVEVVSSRTYKECNYEFNIARNIQESFNDFEVYGSSGFIITSDYEITLNFTYRRPELI